MIIVDESWYCSECSAVGFAATCSVDVTTGVGDGLAHHVGAVGFAATGSIEVIDGLVPPWNLCGLDSMDVNHVELSLFI